MAEMKLRARGTELKIISPYNLVSTQINYDSCKFTFDASWDGYTKTAVFYSDSTERKSMSLDANNSCVIPWENLVNAGVLYIGIFGIKGSSVLPTNWVEHKLIEGSYVGADPSQPTQDIYLQLISDMAAFRDAEALRAIAENGRVANNSAWEITETERVNKENVRISNNTSWSAAESNRVIAESERKTLFDSMIKSSYIIPKTPVPTFADIATTYSSPEIGWTVKTLDTGNIYRYDGNSWMWSDTITSSSYDALLSDIGDKSQLQTVFNTNLVGAINENTSQLATKANSIDVENRFRDLTDSKKILDFTIIPKKSNGEVAWSGMAFIQDNIVTYNESQYIVMVNKDKNPVICKRVLETNQWTFFDLSTIVGNPLASPSVDDLHNVYCLAVDSNGYIHLSGNMHANSLRYIRSTNPEDITSWTIPTMIGTEENSVTYPQFVKLPNGKLLFFYRNGGSGNGNTYVNIYNTITKTWTRKVFLFSGEINSENAYMNHIGVDWNTGSIQIMYCWRSTGNASTNSDICFVKSDDEGVTWKKADGTIITLPITHDTSEIIFDTPNEGGVGLANQCGFEVDNDGNPHGAYWKYDENGYSQLYHFYHNGTSWITERVTNWSYRIETNVSIVEYTISRPSVVTTKDNRVFIVYRNNIENKGTLRMLEITPGKPKIDFPILNLDLYGYEFTFDTTSMKTENKLNALIVPCNFYGSSTTGYNHANNWNEQYTAVLSINMYHVNELIKNKVKLPRIQPLINNVFTLSANTTSITFADIINTIAPSTNILLYNNSFKNPRVLYRLTARANQVSGTGFVVGITEKNGGGAIMQTVPLLPFSTAIEVKNSNWIPLKAITDNSSFFLTLGGLVAAASEGKVSFSTLELGYLDY